MSKKFKFPIEERLNIVADYLAGKTLKFYKSYLPSFRQHYEWSKDQREKKEMFEYEIQQQCCRPRISGGPGHLQDGGCCRGVST
jgi:hypothetical protein